jgi:C_GCAxxG_C_C family probable redox protein
MTPQEMKKRAQELFTQRMHCSQSVLTAGQEKLNRVNYDIVRALGAFGGGFAGTGNVCGCVVGAMAFIGSLYCKSQPSEKEDPHFWRIGRGLMQEFEKLTQSYGGIRCIDIAGVDWNNRDQVNQYYSKENGRWQRCVDLVGETARLLGDILESIPNIPASGVIGQR